MTKLNDLVSFIRFSLNDSAFPPPPPPPRPQDQLIDFFNKYKLPIDRRNLFNGNSSHTTDIKLRRLLNFKK